jgi:hypothetical protein
MNTHTLRTSQSTMHARVTVSAATATATATAKGTTA